MISVVYDSPVGKLTLISDGAALAHCEFENPRYAYDSAPAGKDKILDQARRELDLYFKGKLKDFDVPVAPRGTENGSHASGHDNDGAQRGKWGEAIRPHGFGLLKCCSVDAALLLLDIALEPAQSMSEKAGFHVSQALAVM